MVLTPEIRDCVIVGGGPAGLTAALYLARFLRSVMVFDAGDGRAGMIPNTHNLAPFPEGMAGPDLLDRMRTHARLYGATLETDRVARVDRQGEVFRITTDRQTATARSVIFACGVFNHRPPLSVSDHDRGLARGLIRYCPVCDAFEVRGKRIAVLGTGAHGGDEASFIRHYSAWVTLIPPDRAAVAARDGVGHLDAPLKTLALTGDEVIVTLDTDVEYRFDTLYVALGTTPRTKLADALGLRLGPQGHITVDARQKTSMARVYAIGDLTEGLDQIAVAMGQAAVAATAIHNDLSGRMA